MLLFSGDKHSAWERRLVPQCRYQYEPDTTIATPKQLSADTTHKDDGHKHCRQCDSSRDYSKINFLTACKRRL
jgi:hypothetical protein